MNSTFNWLAYRSLQALISPFSGADDAEKKWLDRDEAQLLTVSPSRLIADSQKNKVVSGASDKRILVDIDQDGHFHVVDGHEHANAARTDGLSSVDVRVRERHKAWQRFRLEVFRFSQTNAKGSYQPLIHPDFYSFPAHRKEDRWPLIFESLPISSGSVLDIGSNLGYFCHKFEEMGFSCTAVEYNRMYLYFLKQLRRIEHKKFDVFSGSVFSLDARRFDVVLALSIFHHFLRTKELFELMQSFLRNLELQCMYFEPHASGHGFPGAYVDFSEEEFVAFIQQHTGLKNARFLGRTDRGRGLYLLDGKA